MMKRIGLIDVDGHAKKKKFGATIYPNLALCKISAWHKTQVRGVCDQERSMISPDYARNFICDFILGKEQVGTQMSLFE